MNKNKLYWMLQFGGWGGLMLTSFLAMVMFMPFLPALGTNLMAIFLGVFVSHLYRGYVKRKNWKDLRIAKLWPKVFLASVLQGALLSILTLITLVGVFVLVSSADPEALNGVMGIPEMEGVDEETMEKIRQASIANFSGSKLLVFLLSFVASYAIYFICWSALYFAYQYLQKAREMEIEGWKLSASIKDAELSTLKAQINPHFMFNSLNNIRSLVVEDSERARDAITHLSDLLRFSVQFDQYEKVSLEKELEVVLDYLKLEAIQLEERLQYTFDIDKKTKEMLIPPMIVQTLVENAIKHSINNLPNGGEIIIKSAINNDFLFLNITNTGQLKRGEKPVSGEKRRGIGISNARERLRLLYGENSGLTVQNLNEHMVCATVKIPLNDKERFAL
ncbi:sensor histidine kinase [Roseivirga sp. E12]|uniref:sensor histidine kinase n=1 Tax=Roseivirga sp. E12 TaxID=2819237 RepID=UPI001ABC77F2|nr:histidine kinase [Roseivirga sp. E12]MBO3698769.1 histidine kinase [Roseivirga sp. E12]